MTQDQKRYVIERLDVTPESPAEIKVFGVEGTNQYIVSSSGAEYFFTNEIAARDFAAELASKREIFKTASLDREEVEHSLPPTRKSPQWKGMLPWN